MIKFQQDSRNGSRTPAFRTVGLVCLALLALLVVVQIAHVHPVETDADHCPLCVAMHSAAPVAALTAAIVLIRIGSLTPLFETCVVVRHRHPKRFTRPPPAGN